MLEPAKARGPKRDGRKDKKERMGGRGEGEGRGEEMLFFFSLQKVIKVRELKNETGNREIQRAASSSSS